MDTTLDHVTDPELDPVLGPREPHVGREVVDVAPADYGLVDAGQVRHSVDQVQVVEGLEPAGEDGSYDGSARLDAGAVGVVAPHRAQQHVVLRGVMLHPVVDVEGPQLGRAVAQVGHAAVGGTHLGGELRERVRREQRLEAGRVRSA